jgi:triphosphoribosyl-dephospho-CoA synthase
VKHVTVSVATSRKIAQAAQNACLLEVSAAKPGNVNRHHDFTDACFEDFLLSAVAIGPAMELAGRAGVGCMIRQAIRDTQSLVQTNTNLGIVLLLAPLAKACFRATRPWQPGLRVAPGVVDVQRNLVHVLASLTLEDARQVYAAIRLARPGGMGQVSQADVAEVPSVTLQQAMALAQNRDAIAREYTTNFAITFGIGYPALEDAWRRSGNLSTAIVQAYLTILARVPDSLIARKRGPRIAGQVSQRAAQTLVHGGVFTAEGQAQLGKLDHALRDENHTLNPGTTADLTTAAIFLLLYCSPHILHRTQFDSPSERHASCQKEKFL